MPISKIKTSSITGDAASINLNIDAGTLFLDVANNRVGIANTAPDLPLDVRGTVGTNGDAYRTMVLLSTNTATANYGGGIAFGGFFNGTTNRTNDFAGIQGFKENGTQGDYAGALRFTTRINGGNPTERVRIDSTGNFFIGATTVGAGFTGPQLVVGKSANPYGIIEIQGNKSGSNGASGLLMFYNTAGSSRLGVISAERTGADNSGNLVFTTFSSGVGNERLRIDAIGNISTNGYGNSSNGTFNGTLQVGSNLQLMSYGVGANTQTQLASNTYYSGGYKAIAGGAGASKVFVGGAGSWSFDGNAVLTNAGDAIPYVTTLGCGAVDNTVYLQGASSYVGTGITFPATQYASSNPNTLDDYEEGTWTPVLKLGASNQTLTGSINAKYTKVGNIVNFFAELYFTKVGTGDFSVTAMPFVSAAIRQCNVNFYFQFYTSSMPSTHKLTYMESSGTSFNPQFMPAGGTQTVNINDTHFTGSTNYFYFAGSYIVA